MPASDQQRGKPPSSLDESLLDHEVPGFTVIALGKTARSEHRMEFFQHTGASAQHHAIGLDIEARKPEVGEKLIRRDQISDPAAVAEWLPRHGRIIDQLVLDQRPEQFVLPKIVDKALAI